MNSFSQLYPLSIKLYHKAETAARRSAGNDLPALMMAGQKDVIF
nr:MAG TPA: hypothetical protein [Caudoviricetes sp.]